MIAVLIAALAALVAAAFAVDLARRSRAGRRLHEAVWAASLGLFAVACGAVSVGLGTGWSQTVYGLFWFAGALVTVPLLAVGQMLLLDPRRSRVWLAAAVVAAMASLLAVTVSGMDTAALEAADARGGIPVGHDVWGASPATALLAPFNWAGLVVVGGCVWSAVRTRRPRVLLIALGVLVAGASFSFVRGGDPSLFTATLAMGVTLMYGGFLAASPRPAAAGETGSAAERLSDHG
jgi:uncharacterized membrane protein YhaH (DUF805 family)